MSSCNKDNLFYYINPEGETNEDRIRYRNKIVELNALLSINKFPEMGDLFDPSIFSVNKTLIVIQSLIEDKLKLTSSKTELLQKLSKSENDNLSMIEKVEISKDKIAELNKKIEFFKNKSLVDEKKFNEEIEKIKNEKNEMEKAWNRLAMKESQYKHEIKKCQIDYEDLKLRIKKLIGDKENLNSTNTAKETRDKSPGRLSNSKSNLNTGNEIIFPKMTISSTLVDPSQDLGVRNTDKILHNVNNLKEFYNLIYDALSEKVNHILIENEDMKQCFKLVWTEIESFIEYKKLFLYKLTQDNSENLKSMMKVKNLINFQLFELDFNVSRNEVLSNFNDILNIFRFVLIYDILKVEPNQEFEFEEIKNLIINKKSGIETLPYYNQLKKFTESFDFSKLESLKKLLLKSKINLTNSKKSILKDEIFLPIEQEVNTINVDYKEIENIADINKNIFDTLNAFEEKLKKMDN